MQKTMLKSELKDLKYLTTNEQADKKNEQAYKKNVFELKSKLIELKHQLDDKMDEIKWLK